MSEETPRYQVYGEYLVQEVGGCTGGACGVYGHEPTCGLELVAPIEQILQALADREAYRRLALQMAEIRGSLDRVPVYEGLVDSSPVAVLVSELVRDHGELEARIDNAMHVIRGLLEMGVRTAETGTEALEVIAAILSGRSGVPDTPEALDGPA